MAALAAGIACGGAPAEGDESVGEGASALTASLHPVADTYLDEDRRNRAFGGQTTLRLDGDDRDRALVRFDLAGLAGARIASAKLRLSVVDAPRGCRASGLRLGAFRMRRGWTESGATFACPNDVMPGNGTLDCPGGTWNMEPGHSGQAPWVTPATSTAVLRDGGTETAVFDVTADVRVFVSGGAPNDGWLVQKLTREDEGRVSFGSRESAKKPVLVVTFSTGA